MIGIKKRYFVELGIALSILFLKLKPKNYDIPPPIKPPKIKVSEKIEEKMDILPPPPPLTIKGVTRKLKKPVLKEEWLEEGKVKKGRKKIGKELKKLILGEKRRKELEKKEEQRIEKEEDLQKRLEGLIKNAEEKRKLEEEREKYLEILRKQQEKEKLKYEDYIKRMKVSEKKKGDKKVTKEIRELLIRLDSGIKAIDKHEKILHDDVEKNLRLAKHRLEQAEVDLKTEKDYINEAKKIKEKISSFEGLADQGKTNLDMEIKDLKCRYNNYIHKAEGIRRAILAKINYIKKASEDIDTEEKKQKEFEKEKKKILEVEKLLARKRKIKDIQTFFRGVGLYKTKEDIIKEGRKKKQLEEKRKEQLEELKKQKKLEEEKKEKELKKLMLKRQKEQEKRIEEDKKRRELELETRKVLDDIRRVPIKKEEIKKKKISKKLEKKKRKEERERIRLEEKLKLKEKLREKEKEKLREGDIFIQLFKAKPKPKDEIQKAIDQLKIPAKKTIKPDFIAPRTNSNDIEYINQRIADAREALMNFNLERAKKIYIDILKVYNNLSVENKRKVHESVKELYDERKNAERVAKR